MLSVWGTCAGAAGAAGAAGGLGFGSEYDASSEDTYGKCHTKVKRPTADCLLHTTLLALYLLRYDDHYGDAYPGGGARDHGSRSRRPRRHREGRRALRLRVRAAAR